MLFECRLSRLVHDPALEEDVDEEDGQERENGGGEHETLIGGVLGLEPDQQKRDGTLLGRGEDDEGPEVIVPGCHEGEDAERGERRSHLREDDARVDAEFGGAVDAGGVHQFAGHGLDELLHHEDAVCIHHRGDDQRPERIDETELDNKQIVRNHDHLEGDHDLDEDDTEGKVLAFEVIFCKDVTCKGTCEQRDDHARNRDDHAVHHVALDGNPFVGEDGNVMLEGRFLREEIRRGLAELSFGLERGDHDVEERQERGDKSKDENSICARFTEDKANGGTFWFWRSGHKWLNSIYDFRFWIYDFPDRNSPGTIVNRKLLIVNH